MGKNLPASVAAAGVAYVVPEGVSTLQIRVERSECVNEPLRQQMRHPLALFFREPRRSAIGACNISNHYTTHNFQE